MSGKDDMTMRRVKESMEEFGEKELTLMNFEDEFTKCMAKIETMETDINSTDSKINEIKKDYKPNRDAALKISRPGKGGPWENAAQLLRQAMSLYEDRKEKTALSHVYMKILVEKLYKALVDAKSVHATNRVLNSVENINKQMLDAVNERVTSVTQFFKDLTNTSMNELRAEMSGMRKEFKQELATRNDVIKELTRMKTSIDVSDDVKDMLRTGEMDTKRLEVKIGNKVRAEIDRALDILSEGRSAPKKEKPEKEAVSQEEKDEGAAAEEEPDEDEPIYDVDKAMQLIEAENRAEKEKKKKGDW